MVQLHLQYLAQYIFNEGMKQVEKGSNPIELYRGIKIGVKEIVDVLVKEVSQNIKTNERLRTSTISRMVMKKSVVLFQKQFIKLETMVL